jgi:hypothetical protein
MTEHAKTLADPPALLAIIRAARRIGDKQLERAARKELAERYGIEVVFRKAGQQEEVTPCNR